MTHLAAAADSAADPLDLLDALRALTDAVAVIKQSTIAAARGERASWAAIGARLHVSKQAVARAFGGQVGTVAPAGDSTEPATRTRKSTGWDVMTPRGRTLLRVVRRP